MPESSSARAPTAAAQKKNFWPALYLPTLGSSLSENFMYSSTLKRRSFLSNIMSRNQCTNITSDAAANATPSQACNQRHTERPPKRYAIQPNTGDQMGMPVRSDPKKKIATVQWTTREERRWRTISSPTTTSSRSRATSITDGPEAGV